MNFAALWLLKMGTKEKTWSGNSQTWVSVLAVFVLKINTLIFRTVLGLQKIEHRGPISLLFPSPVSSAFSILL